jgi:hypothetical protein
MLDGYIARNLETLDKLKGKGVLDSVSYHLMFNNLIEHEENDSNTANNSSKIGSSNSKSF